ncbi:universal stress protein [Leifsonia sp. 2MCAF36]|uniref:universal stress protein n=1 Tax=Leifsonia sp. 2MCAF36 TaxID=3232988 RepID=UPI003F9B598C
MTDHTPSRPGGYARVILVGVEGGRPDAVLLSAAELARDLGCELVCAHVDLGRYTVEERPDGSVHSLPIDPDLPELDEEGFDPALAAEIERVLGPTGVRWSVRSLAGEPARALGHLANTLNARMIIVGTHEAGLRRGMREFFRSSVAVHLAHRQHRPVLVIPLSPVTDDSALPWE